MNQTVHAIVDKEGNVVFNAITLTPGMVCMACMDAWNKFFRDHSHQLPLGEAIKAYESIGYRCAKFKLVEIKKSSSKCPDCGSVETTEDKIGEESHTHCAKCGRQHLSGGALLNEDGEVVYW